ncbi:MAG: hypothetical protein WC295_11740 [Methanoregula sp.]
MINGVDEGSITDAMRAGIDAATRTGGVLYIGAANFEGKLGEFRFNLHDVWT